MKITILTYFTILFLASCSKDEPAVEDPVAQLPPETQTGANTIGCLVNGEVLLPRQNNPLGPFPIYCHYQYINEWNFSLSLSNDKTSPLRSVHIQSNIELIEGNIYIISNNYIKGSYLLGGGIYGSYITNVSYIGELKITKLDYINNIISGTFYFDAVKQNTGEIVKIREGRFDMKFTA